jgi:hypothetical protein
MDDPGIQRSPLTRLAVGAERRGRGIPFINIRALQGYVVLLQSLRALKGYFGEGGVKPVPSFFWMVVQSVTANSFL